MVVVVVVVVVVVSICLLTAAWLQGVDTFLRVFSRTLKSAYLLSWPASVHIEHVR
jgi:hypothetical protein